MTDSNTTAAIDPIEAFKAKQREAWSSFAPLAANTTITAARLVRFARVQPNQRVLDVGCGTGVVAITAALHAAARVTGADLTPELLEVARENARIDVVLSQFGHIFAPRPDVAVGEMLRVLKSGGTIAFSTWPPELFNGRMFALIGRNMPPPPPGVSPPKQWGDPNIVRERLGAAVRDLTFDRDIMVVPALSPAHHRTVSERTAGPLRKLVESLERSDPAKLAEVRREYDATAAENFSGNAMHQGYLMTRAVKK